MIIEEKFKVGIADINVNSTLSDKGILKFFETIACHHSDLVGYGVCDIPRTHLSWVLLNWRIEVKKRPHYNDEVVIKTWARSATKVSTMRDFLMESVDGETLVKASTKWALIDIEKGLMRISPEIISVYQPEESAVFDDGTISRLAEAVQGEPITTYTVLRRDIDLNQHVHNLFYLDFAREALPKELAFADFDSIEIAYKNGAKLGDKLDIYYQCDCGAHIITIKNSESGILNSIVKLKNE